MQGTDYDVLVRQGVTEQQLSGFGQLDFHLTHTLTISAGARYEHDKANFFEVEGGPLGRGGNGRVTAGPIIAAPGQQPDAPAVPPNHHAVAVVFDFMQPIGAARRLAGRGRKARLDNPTFSTQAKNRGISKEDPRKSSLQARRGCLNDLARANHNYMRTDSHVSIQGQATWSSLRQVFGSPPLIGLAFLPVE